MSLSTLHVVETNSNIVKQDITTDTWFLVWNDSGVIKFTGEASDLVRFASLLGSISASKIASVFSNRKKET